MFNDFPGWQQTSDLEEHRAEQAERERQAACELLLHRGNDAAAFVVAAAIWRSDCVDNWNGGHTR
jgi:hypothetical protein